MSSLNKLSDRMENGVVMSGAISMLIVSREHGEGDGYDGSAAGVTCTC